MKHVILFAFGAAVLGLGTARGQADAAVVEIVRPEPGIPPGVFAPSALVANLGGSSEPCTVICRISRPGGGLAESFTDVTFPPAGWHEFHPHPDGGTYNWYRGTDYPLSPPGYAVCQREASLLPNNDWLVTPKVRVRAKDTLYFWFRSLATSGPPESIEVWVSYTDGQPGSFTRCIQAFKFTNDVYQLGWASLRLVGDTMVYFGFRYGMSGLGTGILLDDIQLRSAFHEDTAVVTPAPGETVEVTFGSWDAAEGHYVAAFTVHQKDDEVPENDVLTKDFLVSRIFIPPSNWTERAPMPAAPSRTPGVKEGGALTYMAEKGLIYAAKGRKVGDFYAFDPVNNLWYHLPPVEGGASGKMPRRGARLASDNRRYVYLIKGNNTMEFWRYDADSTVWEGLEPLTEAPDRKKVKGGGDLIHVPAIHGKPEQLYLLKGGKTDFHRYTVETGKWEQLPGAPWVDRAKYNEGSFLVYDGDRTVYCQQSNYFLKDSIPAGHSMFRFDIVGDSWYGGHRKGMPLLGKHSGRLREKKSKDGGCAAWYNGEVYALKGGNTQMFYRGNPLTGLWEELDTILALGSTDRKRKVKAGADIVNIGNAFYALKGNNTLEMWRYAVPTTGQAHAQAQAQARDGVAGDSRSQMVDYRFEIASNPLVSGWATLRFGPRDRRMEGQRDRVANLRVFDAAGRCVLSRSLVIGNWSLAIPLDLRRLSGGVYLVRLDADDRAQTQKLVIRK